MLFVSVSEIGVKQGKPFTILHWYETSGVFISNIEIVIDEIGAICPLDNSRFTIPTLGTLIQRRFAAMLPVRPMVS